MTSTVEAGCLSASTSPLATSALPSPPSHQPSSFTFQRPPPLDTTATPSSDEQPSAQPSSAASSSASTSSSPAPLVLSPSDFSSILTLKQNYDSLHTEHTALLATLAPLQAQLAHFHTQHAADEAEWERRVVEGREQYERVMKDWSEESEKRHRAEQCELRSKQQLEEVSVEQRRTDCRTRLVEADLTNERRLRELLEQKVQQLEHSRAQTAASASDAPQGAEPGEDCDENASLLSVHNAVLSRRVQRLEMELSAASEQLVQQRAIHAQQSHTLDDIRAHLAAINEGPYAAAAAGSGSERGEDAAVVAEVECVVLRERLKCELRSGRKRERKMYCLALVWLIALLMVSVGGLLCV